MKRLLVFAALLFVLPAHAEVTIDWVTVGDPGNACDTQTDGCFGAVAYAYQIGKYEVTNAQYAEFLNAVAATDTYGALQHEHGLGLRRHHAQRQLGELHVQRHRRPRGHAGELRVVLRRAALRELAAQRPADGGAGRHDDRGRRLHDHRRRGSQQLDHAQCRCHGLPHQRGRVVQGGVLRPGRRATSTTRRARTPRPPVRCPGRRRTRRTATGPWAISPTWGATRARRAPTAPSTRAATSGSGTRPSSAARIAACGAGASTTTRSTSRPRTGSASTPDDRGRRRRFSRRELAES